MARSGCLVGPDTLNNAGLPATRLVYVADREADMMPLMARAQELSCPVDCSGRLFAQQGTRAACTATERSAAHDRPSRRLPGPKKRWGTWCQDDLGGIA